MSDQGEARLLKMGAVGRARGYRLYTTDGRRLIDLYQDGGRAILGHGSSRSTLAARNAAERGLVARLPSVYHDRLVRAVRSLIPGAAVVRVYRSMERALAALSAWLGRPLTFADVADPALGDEGEISLWRPFLSSRAPCRILLPVLPFAGDPPQVVVADSEDAPPSELVAPYQLAGLARAAYDLAAAPVPQALDLPGFRAVGPYLVPSVSGEAYARRFSVFLKEGVLLSPWDSVPSIVPAESSSGERALLRRVSAYAVQSEAIDG